MFSFFSRKPQPPPETVPLPPSPGPSTSTTKAEKNVQLRTPSPSVDSSSAANAKVRSASPTTKISRMSLEERNASPTRRGSIGGSTLTAIVPNPAFVPPEPTIESLSAHLAGIPPKTLHAYVLSRIPRTEPDVLPALAGFFSELAPPQRMHCVRCHKDFVEVENDDRACLVPHDDESAEVERVGAAARANRVPGTVGATFETLWGCCGKIVEGDGDQGPPDGWCYEGKHTTDIKRARFRADSTVHNDKLVSCLRLNCHGIRAQLPRGARSMRKRPRSMNLKEATTDEDDESEGGSDSGMDEIAGNGKPTPRSRVKGKGKAAKAKSDAGAGDAMDVDEPQHQADTASVAGSARGRGRPLKTKAQGTPGGAQKRRVRVADATVVPGTDGEDDDARSVRSAPASAKRRGRLPKSKAMISDSDREAGEVAGEKGKGEGKEKEKKSAKAGPRSLSRTRVAEGSDANMGVAKPKLRAKKVREANAKGAGADGAEGDDEKPKKRRKVASP